MMLQRDIFIAGEGKAWLDRNKDKLGKYDPVSEQVKAAGIHPKSVLEIGCADGWRLLKLEDKYDCHTQGIDPSVSGWLGNGKSIIEKGTADDLSMFASRVFDLVIFGFCLYLCDPQDYFKIVAESDRVLQDGGYLIIHDFDGPDGTKTPYRHHKDVWSYRMNWSQLWLSHPAYSPVHHERFNEHEAVDILRKDMKHAFQIRSAS